ncbi:17-beta-hydroxysteroid dehydrogenase 13-like isoform X1 [Spodoptera frugiperda]|uniref:Short-chain dehydrogenase/reductase 3 n=1 Tax=Spodoptera frugiperda TaxID=7108 RepID=A0A9R0DVV1_SPOFR|nr:17-beta-hydroxysteroid dehydrogenase 13-like isoform X1 [Spodoptera frugiperda]
MMLFVRSLRYWAEEPQVIYVLRIIFEVIWMLLRLNFEIIKALFRVVVPQDRKDVTGDVILVTGAGHGMGREIATRFGKLGARVVCVDINAKGNEETISLIKKNKGEAYAYICDVTDRAAVFQLAEKVEKDVGQVDILVNNAGIMPCKPVLKQTEKEIRATMEINVNGNLWMIQAFLPAMLDRNSGHIVAMSSMAGKMGLRNLVPYCGSKYAVRGIMESLAVELHEDPRNTNGIKFTTICPYIVNTGLCHNPRIRFEAVMKTVDPGDAADQIVDAVLREYHEITIPSDMYYSNKIYNLFPPSGGRILTDFIGTGLDPHD